jgi:GntR family transcriptional regulator
MAKPPVKAQQLADRLGDLIRSGELTPGQWLPSERQLAESYGAVRSTIRQAVQMLVEVGLVEHHEGSGARVREASSDAHAGEASVDAAAVHGELSAIRAELQEMNTRLRALEDREAGSGQAEP